MEEAITELRVGEALVSFLDENGQPGIVDRALILPPKSQIGPITHDLRMKLIHQSKFCGLYEKVIDRESAYELLKARSIKASQPQTHSIPYHKVPSPKSQERKKAKRSDSIFESLAKSAARSVGRELGL